MLKWSCRFVFNCLKNPSTIQFLRWNHYKSLGLTPAATFAEIKDAYYKLSKIYHPDRNNGSEASAQKFRDIVAAYEVLRKPNARKKYDGELTRLYEATKSDSGSKKKLNKRIKKSSKSAKSHLKNDIKSKSKQRNLRRYEQEDVEKFFSSHKVLTKPQVINIDSSNLERLDKTSSLKKEINYSQLDHKTSTSTSASNYSFQIYNTENLKKKNEKWREMQLDTSKLGHYYLKLSKFRLTSFVVMTSMIGYAMAPLPFDFISFLSCSVGTGLVSSAANSINQYLEVPFDAQMCRTRNRVLVQGHLSPLHAVGFATGASTLGLLILYLGTNTLTATLAASNLLLYTMIYTPLKRISILNTWVGSVVGAIPPLMGWAACQGSLDLGAFILGGILYAWQFPHFNALSWNLRPDYSKAGYRMMAVINPELCRRTALRYTIGITICSCIAPFCNLTNWFFALLSTPLNLYFVYLGAKFYRKSDSKNSRKLFHFSLLHLPLLMGSMLLTKQGLFFFTGTENNKKDNVIFQKNEESNIGLIKNLSSPTESKKYSNSQVFHVPL